MTTWFQMVGLLCTTFSNIQKTSAPAARLRRSTTRRSLAAAVGGHPTWRLVWKKVPEKQPSSWVREIGSPSKWVFPKMVGFPSKSSILIWISIVNHPFWGTPIFANNHAGFLFLGIFLWFILTTVTSVLRWSSSYFIFGGISKINLPLSHEIILRVRGHTQEWHTPPKTNGWIPKMMACKRWLHSNTAIRGLYVRFLECKPSCGCLVSVFVLGAFKSQQLFSSKKQNHTKLENIGVHFQKTSSEPKMFEGFRKIQKMFLKVSHHWVIEASHWCQGYAKNNTS